MLKAISAYPSGISALIPEGIRILSAGPNQVFSKSSGTKKSIPASGRVLFGDLTFLVFAKFNSIIFSL
ncbi:MAG: hypothetical protein ACOC1K_01510 [Nanoarchaeota archaeon]